MTYLNTDLDLVSTEDLTALAAAFAAAGVFALHVTCGEDGLWHATLETEDQHAEPEPNIAALVSAAETLREAPRLAWQRCSKRECNIGYECGAGRMATVHSLSPALLGRLAAVGAALGVTVYPPAEPPLQAI